MDVFDRLPNLARPDAWHRDAITLLEEARSLEALFAQDRGLEIWATLGGLTQARLDRRLPVSNAIGDLIELADIRPGWPIIARCLVRLASADVPGRYFAALALHGLMTTARKHDQHRDLLRAESLEQDLDGWRDPALSAISFAIRILIASPAGEPSYAQALGVDALSDSAEKAEAALDIKSGPPPPERDSARAIGRATPAFGLSRRQPPPYRSIVSDDTNAFKAFLFELERHQLGQNYHTMLDVHVFELAHASCVVPLLLEQAFPGAKPRENNLTWMSAAVFRNTVERCFAYVGDDAHGGAPSSQIDIDEYWEHVRRFVSLDDTVVLAYGPDPALPGNHTYWQFCGVLVDEAALRVCILYGCASD